jgi:hypothetical protein
VELVQIEVQPTIVLAVIVVNSLANIVVKRLAIVVK